MQIDSILPNRMSPGQVVVIQGGGLATVEKVFFDGQEVSFKVDGESLTADVPDGSGPVEVVVEGGGDNSNAYQVTIE